MLSLAIAGIALVVTFVEVPAKHVYLALYVFLAVLVGILLLDTWWKRRRDRTTPSSYGHDIAPDSELEEFESEDDRRNRLRREARNFHLLRLVRKQNGLCAICKEYLPDALDGIHVDHITPLARGGDNHPDNLQATHAKCNLAKGSD